MMNWVVLCGASGGRFSEFVGLMKHFFLNLRQSFLVFRDFRFAEEFDDKEWLLSE